MIKLKLQRIYFADTYTISKMYINGKYFSDCLEDKIRLLPLTCPYTPKWQECKCCEKIKHETAIPFGSYKVTLTYSNVFKKILPLIHDVPYFLGIRIHSGSNSSHSSGCILVGKNTIKGALTKSKVTMDRLMKILEGDSELEIVVE